LYSATLRYLSAQIMVALQAGLLCCLEAACQQPIGNFQLLALISFALQLLDSALHPHQVMLTDTFGRHMRHLAGWGM
jgi:hypothetical protein